jgi:signal transduction histidine kinase
MQQIVKEALERLAWQIAEREAEITYPEEWPEVRGHPQLVEEVWANYISNALKYGGTRPRIALGYDANVITREGNRYCRFWVQDSGPGVPTQLRESLFEPFVRADSGHMRSNGHGLGLNIVRRIV